MGHFGPKNGLTFNSGSALRIVFNLAEQKGPKGRRTLMVF